MLQYTKKKKKSGHKHTDMEKHQPDQQLSESGLHPVPAQTDKCVLVMQFHSIVTHLAGK